VMETLDFPKSLQPLPLVPTKLLVLDPPVDAGGPVEKVLFSHGGSGVFSLGTDAVVRYWKWPLGSDPNVATTPEAVR
jgi:hypothetical protein